MAKPRRQFGRSIKVNPALLMIIGGSLVIHAVVFTIAFLAPKEPPPSRHPFTDCGKPAESARGYADTGGASITTGTSGGGFGGGGFGASGSLGPRAMTTIHARYLPCCGPGCVSSLEFP